MFNIVSRRSLAITVATLLWSSGSVLAEEYFVGGPLPVSPGQGVLCGVTNDHPTAVAQFGVRYFNTGCSSRGSFSDSGGPGFSSGPYLAATASAYEFIKCVVVVNPATGTTRFKNYMRGTMTLMDVLPGGPAPVPLTSVPLTYAKKKPPCLP